MFYGGNTLTDIHTHILYGLDDGSDYPEKSLNMLEIAHHGGTNSVVLTPHCNVPGLFKNYYSRRLVEHFENFKKEAAHIPVTLYLGMEVYATDNLPELIHQNRVTTINQSRYLLMEFPFDCNASWATHILNEVSKTGLIPIVAHPERYYCVQRYPHMIFDWVLSGCLIQVNKGSVSGKFGSNVQDTVHRLLKHNLVHFVASDSHSDTYRTPYMADVHHHITKLFHPEYANLIFSLNPQNVIEDKKIIVPDPIPFTI